jgi:hypothetical protein
MKQRFLRNEKDMHKRLTELCKLINSNHYTNLNDVMTHLAMSKSYYAPLKKSKIVYKKDGYYRAAERLTQGKLDELVKLCKLSNKKYNSKLYKSNPSQPTLFTKTKVKIEPKKVVAIESKKVVSRRKATLGIVQRLKVLFTGKI